MHKAFTLLLAFVFFVALTTWTSEVGIQRASVVGTLTLATHAAIQDPAQSKEARAATLSFVGDCTLGENVGRSYFEGVWRKKGAEWFLSGVARYFGRDDLTIANLEGALTEETRHIGIGEFHFRGDPDYARILSEGGVDAVDLANNHTMDYGEKGYADTQDALSAVGVAWFGDEGLLVRDVGGIRIGFYGLSFTDDTALIEARTLALREQGAELVVASFHDGEPGIRYTPTERQRRAATRAIDAGADLVIQHHPHVLQEISEYKGKLIAYSLGNFCYGGHSAPADMDSIILQVQIKETKKGFKITHRAIPVSISSSEGYNDYRPKVAKGSDAARILRKLK
ncbi:MAG: CapA family protein [Clostridiales Family XIII bacterium]|jgi:poly-gamma-glutamate synthesis protein (capsule biosynthesis protein)|nr:CapA family protein [Clostridiales Family XIII bacterium]